MRKSKAEIMLNVECSESKIIDNNTIEYTKMNGVKVIRLHLTDIITFPKMGGVIRSAWKRPPGPPFSP